MSLRQKFEEFSIWAGIVGWTSFIVGAIQAFFGLFAFVIGALPGIITLILGIKLLGAKRYAKNLAVSQELEEQDLILLIQEMNTYFKIQGVLIIIGFIIFIIAVASGIIADLSRF